jgi:cephalosporin-C deacetylase
MNTMLARVLHRYFFSIAFSVGLGYCLPSAQAQLNVTTDKPTATYQVGNTANFIVSSTVSGNATYKIYYDSKTLPILTGSRPLNAGQPAFLPYQANEAGVVFCSVTQNGVTRTASTAFSPMNIVPAESEPTDFDAFWASQKNLIQNVPINPEIRFYRQGYGFKTYKLSLGNIEGRRVYGYISVPDEVGTFPAIISLPSYGDVAGVCSPDEMIPQQGKAISVSLSVHNIDPELQDPNAYKPNIITDKSGFYYRYALLGIIQTINYLQTRPDFNKTDIGIVGTSQGGGLALCAAGLDERIKLIAISNPALCEHSAFKIGKASGFPYYLNQGRIFNTETQTALAAKYYDAVYFAKRFQGATFAIVGYQDEVTPAATSFAAIAQLRQKSLVLHAPQLGHEHPEEYWTGRFAFFRKYFPSMIIPPLQTTLAHYADAGADKTTQVGQSIALTGLTELNGLPDNALSVQWEKVSGAGTVHFSDASNRNTQVNFSAAGAYTLRFSATDTRLSNGKTYIATDYVHVTVSGNNGSGNPLTQNYCENKGTKPWHNWIEKVENETFSHNSFKEGYGNFTDKIMRVQRGKTTVLQLTPGYAWLSYPLHWRVWIDFNQDNDFWDAGETVVYHIGSDKMRIEIPIPANAPLGNTRLRVAMQREFFPNPCDVYENGEVEDYTMSITDENTMTVNANATPPASLGSSNQSNYCTAGGLTHNVWISSVRFGDATYTSEREGYGNFIHKSFKIPKSQAVELALKPSFATQPTDVFWKVWMDYDRDGHFTLAENIWSSQGKGLVNTYMYMPSNLISGVPYRMRIVMRQQEAPGGYCATVDSGEMEDYTIIMTGGATQNAAYSVFKDQIRLYPNPVSEELTIDLNAYGGGKGALRIYNAFGKMVWEMPEERFENRQIKLDVANFTDGIYLLMTEGAGLRTLLHRFIVAKQR